MFLCQRLSSRDVTVADLVLIDSKLRAMALLKDIALYTSFHTKEYDVYYAVNPSLRNKMIDQGWTVSTFYAPKNGDWK
ncbi:hypothetical protein PG993_003587 [Apiospora rasikravindrae]|uniref:Uncharacterized protein n=1 Tax=Apiospora rasikravindrae TaxID=990691 RepID=A0ABR1U007_9PEZI